MPHFMEFAAWFWSIGAPIEDAHLYVRPGHTFHECDLRAEMARWDRMFARDHRSYRRREKYEESIKPVGFDIHSLNPSPGY